MRRVRYAVAMSLDGYIAGPNGEFDWIVSDPDVDFQAKFAEFDAFLIGRKTYEAMQGGPAIRGKSVYVISRTLQQKDCKGVTVSTDPARVIAELKAKPGKDIWLFGGGSLFRSLLELGLVDTVEVAVVPVLLGGGIKLLPDPAQRTRLELQAHRVYPATGTVSLTYGLARG